MTEHEYQAARAATIEVRPTPEEIFTRYRELRGRYLYPKEYLYYCLGPLEGKRVLDLGCGEGEVSVQLAKRGADVVGVDLSPELIDVARRQAAADGVKATFIAGDTAQLAVSGVYDVVICKSVLHHVDIRTVLPKILRYVRPGGLVGILEPVALSDGLRRLRLKLPLATDASPDEHPLTGEEFRFVTSCVAEPRLRYFRLLARLERFTGNAFAAKCLVWLDRLLLTAAPLRRFASVAVIVGRPRGC